MFLDMLNRTRVSAHEEGLPVVDGRPDVVVQLESSAQLSLFEFGGEVNCLTWGAVKRLNEAATWIKSNVATLPYLASKDKCDPRKMTIVCHTDASYQQERGCKTQGGFYICITDRLKVTSEQVQDSHLLSWWSGRLKRVVQSTFQAESYAALEGWQRASYLSAMWAEVVLGHPPSHVGMSHPDSPNVVCFTDCASLATHAASCLIANSPLR